PDMLETCSASTTIGIRIAMNNIAANTSISVKADRRRRFDVAADVRRRKFPKTKADPSTSLPRQLRGAIGVALFVAVPNFIAQPVRQLDQPKRFAAVRRDANRRRAGFIRAAVRQKPDRGQAAAVNLDRRRILRFDLQTLIDLKFLGVAVGVLPVSLLRRALLL